MRAKSTARANFAGSSTNPGASACISQGMAATMDITKGSSTVTMTASASSAKPWAALLPFRWSSAENIGTKETVNAPSANSLRKKLGSLSATKKASATGPAPRMAAVRMSRANPATRLSMVNPPTVAIACAKLMMGRV